MSKQEREKRGDRGHAGASVDAAETHAPPSVDAHARGAAADAAARRMAGAGDDGMVVVDSERDPEQLRIELIQRVAERAATLERTVAKFESILRHRKAQPILKKGLSVERIEEKFRERALDLFEEQLLALPKHAVEAAEVGPIGPAVSAVGKVKSAVDDEVRARQEAAEVDAIGAIVRAATTERQAAERAAIARVGAALPLDLVAWSRAPEPPIDEHLVIAQLDALLLEAMRASGTQTVAEELDALGERAHLGGELAAEDRRWQGR